MTGDELRQERMKRGLTYAAFGDWLAERVNADRPETEHVKAYTRQRVYDWETREESVPDKIENVILKERIKALTDTEESSAGLKRKRGRSGDITDD